MALDLFAVFFGGAMAMLPIFATDILGVGPTGLGVLRTMPSAGALVAMLATTRFQPRRNAGRILLVCVGIFGLAMIVFGLSTEFVLSLVALFVAGLVDGVSMVIRLVILRVESPEALRARIASVNHVFIGASNELGAFESGVAATILGVVPSVVIGGVVTLMVVGGVALFSPALRRLDLGRRLIEGPGAQPLAAAVGGCQHRRGGGRPRPRAGGRGGRTLGRVGSSHEPTDHPCRALLERSVSEFEALLALAEVRPGRAKARPVGLSARVGQGHAGPPRCVAPHVPRVGAGRTHGRRRGDARARPHLEDHASPQHGGSTSAMRATRGMRWPSSLRESHAAVVEVIASYADDELFEKQRSRWTGSTSVGSYAVSATTSHYDWAVKHLRRTQKMWAAEDTE